LTSELFSEREKVAILWGTHVTLNTAKNEIKIFERLKKSFSETEIVDLTLICCFFNFFNRLMDSLDVPVEPQVEVDKIKTSVNLDPDKVKSYLETTIENWPTSFPKPNPD
jgi:hypothetical protein